jgi:hypothetical protein
MNTHLKQIRIILVLFSIALILSGVTAILPLEGLNMLYPLYGPGSFLQDAWPSMASWLTLVREALTETYASYPFLAYGFDWLAFGHFIIAIPFLMAARDPARHTWVVPFGTAACLLVLPHALVFGAIRGIPLFWRLVDTTFGFGGLALLLIIRRRLRILQRMASKMS